MKLRRRPNEPVGGDDAYITSLGLNAAYWRRVEAAVGAAHAEDPRKFALAILHFADEVPEGARGGANSIYVVTVLRGRLLLAFGHEPGSEELLALAQRLRRRFQHLVNGFPVFADLDDDMIAQVLRQAVEGKSGPSEVNGPAFVIGAAAAAGLLMDDPAHDLFMLSEWVARLWRASGESYRNQGIL